jgi:hypothetical protein
MQEPGFWIDGQHYPFPESYTLGQTILVSRITGDEFYKYSEALQEGTRDHAVIAAWAAVAVWHKNPEWSIDDVERFVMSIDIEKFELESGGADGDPPPSGSVEQPEPTDSPDNAAE